MRRTKTLKSLEKGIDLLFLFAHDRPDLSLPEIARALGLPKSTAHRLVVTLRDKQLLTTDPATRRYRLDARLLRLHTAVQSRLDAGQVAMPYLRDLAARSGETAQLYLLRGDEVVCAEAICSPNAIHVVPEKGSAVPLHAPASGRAVLAHLPDAFLARYLRERGLRPLTPHTVTRARTLRSLLGRIRRQGYAVTYQQAILGARGVAAPIFDHRGGVVGSLEVSGPTPRFSHRKALGLVPHLRQCGEAVSAALGAPGRAAARSEGRRPAPAPAASRR